MKKELSLKMPTPLADDHIDKDGSTKGHDDNPPPYSSVHPPPSGFRFALSIGGPFPKESHLLGPPFRDLDGSPVYLGSAILERSVHPCKINPHHHHVCLFPYGGSEHGHHGRYDLLPFDKATMEFVSTSNGHVPIGRWPVEGGYEEPTGDAEVRKLYHAVATIKFRGQEVEVPGKTGTHLVRSPHYVNFCETYSSTVRKGAMSLLMVRRWLSKNATRSCGYYCFLHLSFQTHMVGK
jgi:hypothetical protein